MYNLCYKVCFDVYKAENGHESRVSLSGTVDWMIDRE